MAQPYRFSRRPRAAATALAVLLAAALSGCGSSHQLVNVWKDPEQPGSPMTNLLVVAMKRDDAARRLWEDAFVKAFESQGVLATPSYRFFPAAAPDTEQVKRIVKEDGFDGVLVTRRLPSETTTTYVPATVTTVPVTRYNPWLNVFFTDWQEVYEPGHAETGEVVRHRVDVLSTTDDGQLVWTGTSEVLDPTSADAVKHYAADMVVPELVKKDVVGSGTRP